MLNQILKSLYVSKASTAARPIMNPGASIRSEFYDGSKFVYGLMVRMRYFAVEHVDESNVKNASHK